MTEATIEVFVERCMGAGNCAEVAPRHFDQDAADGTVVVLDDHVAAEDRAVVDKAAAVCPVAAILVQDRG